MIRHLTYSIAAIVLIAAAKLLQVTFNEGLERYGKNKDKTKSALEKRVNEKAYKNSKKEIKKDTLETSKETDSLYNATDSATFSSETSDFENAEVMNASIVTSEEVYFQDLINSYLNPIVAELPEGRAREDVTIRYYKHEKDGDHVYALKNLGYYLHEKEAIETKGLESNVLIYGSDVDIRDVRIVAYTLLANEVPLKSIQKSRYEWKFHALEVGTNPSLADQPIMTLNDIRSFEIN